MAPGSEAAEAERLLGFWFGPLGADGFPRRSRTRMWFRAGAALDVEITRRFGTGLRRAAAGELDGWLTSPRSSLALVILLDQFPRNIHRGTPAAFARDAQALAACRQALERRHDRSLAAAERLFLYMPLQHAEEAAAQDVSVRLCQAVWDSATGAARRKAQGFLDSAREHRAIIRRFGRFPHRNRILGRRSSPAEEAFLARHGRNFGQR